MAVPFHISTLKNVSKSDEGDYVMLRLNFITPGQAGAKKDDQVSDFHYFASICCCCVFE
jgi:nucleosome binding factor SPN SPT16 subunit